jgi:bla regulator protein BlaR1
MQNILYNISQVLGITIIHSLWQGLLIYFVLRLALMFPGQLSASKKYLLAVVSLLAITGWFGYTLINEINLYNWLAVAPSKLSALPLLAGLPSGISRFSDQSVRYYYSIEEYLPYIAAIYVAGLLFNTVKLMVARKKTKAIKQNLGIDVAIQQTVNKFTEILNIHKNVKVGLSRLVDVPCMVGYFKPVILLPFALATYLSTDEIEAILLHELAHIKRNDYLVNILQQVISILLFFNPCALLINKIINEERENCCDDLVVKATADPIIYAKALLKLEQTRQNDWQLALAATGNKYQLLNRIERIMKTKKQLPSLRPTLLALLILTMGIGAMALLKPEVAQGKISVKALTPMIKEMLADTGRKAAVKKSAHLQAHSAKKAAHAVKRNSDNDDNSYAYSYSDEDGDKKMQALSAEIQRLSQAVTGYYQSDAFKQTQRELEENGKAIQDFYNRPELKKLQEELSNASHNYSKNAGENDKIKAITEQMGEKGRKISAYYNTPEFKKMNSELKKKYGIPENFYNDDRDRESDNYKKYQAELDTHIPSDVKLTQEELKKMGEQVTAHYDSPEIKAQNKRIQMLGDSLRRAYDDPAIKEKQKEMDRLGREMGQFQNNAEIRSQQRLLEQAIKRMTAYQRSPEYRKYLKSKMNFSFDFNNNNDENEKSEKVEKVEKLERHEKAQKADKAERKEKAEKAEKTEQTESDER